MHIAVPPRRRAAVPLTALVDVVFILLFFFMLASSYLDWRAVRLSFDSGAVHAGADTAWTLLLQADGSLLLNGTPTAPAMLEHQLEGLGDATLQLAAEDGVVLQALVDLLDRVRRAGHAATLVPPEALP